MNKQEQGIARLKAVGFYKTKPERVADPVARDEAIAAMLIAGATWNKIRDALPGGYTAIRRVAKTLDIQVERKRAPMPKPLPENRVNEILELLQGHESISSIARSFGVNRHRIMRIRDKHATNL